MGREEVRGDSRVGALGTRDCAFDGEYAVSGDGDLENRIARIDDAGLPVVRRAACGAANQAAAQGILSTAREHPRGAKPQTLGMDSAEGLLDVSRKTDTTRADEFSAHAVEVQRRV